MAAYEYGLLIGIGGLLIFFLNPFFKVEQEYVYIVERYGKFLRLAHPGLGFYIPFIDTLKGPISLRVTQLETSIEGKTLDDVFVDLQVSIQYRVISDKVYEAFYTLMDPDAHIKTFVADVTRSQIPKIKLHDLFNKKDELAEDLQRALAERTNEFGFEVLQASIIDIRPDVHVKAAMSAINEAKQLKIAAHERGEADKILKKKKLEGEVETKLLEGKGLAGQWGMLLGQLKISLEEIQKVVPNVDPKDVLKLLTDIQNLEMQKEIALIEHAVDAQKKPDEPPSETRDAIIHTATGLTKQMLEKLLPGGGEEKKA